MIMYWYLPYPDIYGQRHSDEWHIKQEQSDRSLCSRFELNPKSKTSRIYIFGEECLCKNCDKIRQKRGLK